MTVERCGIISAHVVPFEITPVWSSTPVTAHVYMGGGGGGASGNAVYTPPDRVQAEKTWDAAEEYPPATPEMSAAEWLDSREGLEWSRAKHKLIRYFPTLAAIKYDEEGRDAASYWTSHAAWVRVGEVYSQQFENIEAMPDEEMMCSPA
jgi:hypothetical protein